MKSKIIKLLAGKASKKEKIQLLLAFLGSSTAVLTALVIVVASLLLVIFIGSLHRYDLALDCGQSGSEVL